MTTCKPKPPKRRDIAEALDVSLSRVSQLAKAGMPRATVREALDWYRRNIDRRDAPTPTNPDGTQKPLAELRAELLCLQIEQTRQKMGILERDLVPLDDAKRIISAHIDSFQKSYRQIEYWLAAKFKWAPEEQAEVAKRWNALERNSQANFMALIKNAGG